MEPKYRFHPDLRTDWTQEVPDMSPLTSLRVFALVFSNPTHWISPRSSQKTGKTNISGRFRTPLAE
jgi:hypothetical protein